MRYLSPYIEMFNDYTNQVERGVYRFQRRPLLHRSKNTVVYTCFLIDIWPSSRVFSTDRGEHHVR